MKPILFPLFVPALVLPLAGQSVDALTGHLREAACLHLDFVQVRTLAALSRPLKATGSLVLARDKGVIWALRTPVAMTYVMGPKGLLVVDEDGHRERRTPREAPMVAQVGRIFQALTQGDWHALESWFTVTGKGRPDQWRVDLKPGPQVAAVLKSVRLEGGRFIERVRLEEAGGDRMDLTFLHQRLDAPLTDAEARLLAQD